MAYSSKFISGTDLFVSTNTDPAKFIKVDISGAPAWVVYTLNVGVEDYKYAKALTLDKFDISADATYAYLACLGEIVKIELATPTTRVGFPTSEVEQLENIAHWNGFRYTYAGSDEVTGELFVIDETTKSHADTKFNWIVTVKKAIKNVFSFNLGNHINTDFRFLYNSQNTVNTDFRFSLYDYNSIAQHLLAREDFHVYIDAVECEDLILPSLRIRHGVDEKSTVSFTLPRYHDKPNYMLDGTLSTITAQNVVTVYIGTHLEFTGKISAWQVDSEMETIDVSCESDELTTAEKTTSYHNKQTVKLPLTTKNIQLHPYDVLLNSIDVDNPYIASTETNPKYYKGVKIDLGINERENVSSMILVGGTWLADKIKDGTFQPNPNCTYFWQVTLKKFGFAGGNVVAGPYYIGTSLIPTTTDLYDIVNVWCRWQRIKENTSTELGYSYVGSAPYREVSAKNGRYVAASRYTDMEDGLYLEQGTSYDCTAYAVKVAQAEYSKLLAINGAVLPKTSANIDLTLDSYLYYNLGILTRINLVNTTQTDIYNAANGFPVAIKSISIDAETMKISITCDNSKSNYEMDLIDAAVGDEPVDNDGFSYMVWDKHDPNNNFWVV